MKKKVLDNLDVIESAIDSLVSTYLVPDFIITVMSIIFCGDDNQLENSPDVYVIVHPETRCTFQYYLRHNLAITKEEDIFFKKSTFIVTDKVSSGVALICPKDRFKLLVRGKKPSKYSYKPIIKISEEDLV